MIILKLVIVESPSKSKTIEKYLGKDYEVLSSKGHIRDLSTKGKYGLGVDIENDFKPDYITIKGKSKLINNLKKEVKKADFVYLATDPDREGEAISWHLFDTLKLKDENYQRIVFNEITKDAVINSFKHARKIDQDLVNSQETRRILDRIIGFRLSKLMQAKTDGTSAGRVQSVALKLIVDKEREISKFNPEEYWTITGIFKDFEADLFNYNNKEIKINTEAEANEILDKLSNTFKIVSVDKKNKNKKSNPPFITSTLQRLASNKLGFNAKKTMSLAQKLYEGIELKDETVGLISYMRTDSVRLSDEFIKSTYGYIKDKFGEEYIGYVKSNKSMDNVQDAHEAIRPTSINRTPESVKPYLSNDEYKLYKMIYYRALASLMKDATTIALNPAQMTDLAEDVAAYKAQKKPFLSFASGISAGACIALAFVFYTTTQTGLTNASWGLAKLVGGLVFSLGVITSLAVVSSNLNIFNNKSCSSLSIIPSSRPFDIIAIISFSVSFSSFSCFICNNLHTEFVEKVKKATNGYSIFSKAYIKFTTIYDTLFG